MFVNSDLDNIKEFLAQFRLQPGKFLNSFMVDGITTSYSANPTERGLPCVAEEDLGRLDFVIRAFGWFRDKRTGVA